MVNYIVDFLFVALSDQTSVFAQRGTECRWKTGVHAAFRKTFGTTSAEYKKVRLQVEQDT